jgi:hypothetical protein
MFTEHNDYEHPHDRLEKMPLFRKGKEIQDVVCMIASLIDDEDEELGWMKQFMLEDAYMLTAKIANAEGGDLYCIRMENAALIRKAGNSLKLHIHSLRQCGFEYADYYQMVRDMIKFGDARWKNFIHPENYQLIEDHFYKKKAII